ncbi:MAG: hypothetical protein H7203_07965 [Rhizobacter sp.]|nr:hypothetical protein [Burkholderiales bacterium]
MRVKHLAILLSATLFFAATASAWAAGEPLTVVYWSAKDCRWCTWWEGSVLGSGGEAKFLKTAEGQAVRYLVIKKPTLARPYAEDDFKADQRWLWTRVNNETDGKIKGFPSFSLYEGDKFVVYALGEQDVTDKLLPAIRERMKK